MAFLNHVDEISKTINIKIDILWYSTSLNSSAQVPVNNTKTPFSIFPNAIPGIKMTAIASSKSGSHIGSISTSTNLSEAA